VHTLVGTGAVGRGGGGGGGLDISNLMKPALARGELQCIGATTLDEHRKHIEKDQALERCVLVAAVACAAVFSAVRNSNTYLGQQWRCCFCAACKACLDESLCCGGSVFCLAGWKRFQPVHVLETQATYIQCAPSC
jgi:hypothetical protein